MTSILIQLFVGSLVVLFAFLVLLFVVDVIMDSGLWDKIRPSKYYKYKFKIVKKPTTSRYKIGMYDFIIYHNGMLGIWTKMKGGKFDSYVDASRYINRMIEQSKHLEEEPVESFYNKN